MRFATWVFRLSALYGVVLLAPMLFMERTFARLTTTFTHPEYFYGFLGAALSFQLVFWQISRDPVRLRPIMIPAVVEKWVWGVVAWIVFLQGRTQASVVAFASIDIVLGGLFAVAWLRTPKA